jgi:peptidyl-prolyl cis-trans isomerase C
MFVMLMSACGENDTISSATATLINSPQPTTTHTLTPPTPTPELLAARINGEKITLAEFESEVARYISGQVQNGQIDEIEARQIVLNDLITQVLLAQGANESGYRVDAASLQGRIDQLIVSAGGDIAFDQWLEANSYNRESFERALKRSMESAWMRDQILAQVPDRAEHVHARQILLFDSEQANQALADLRTGTEFATLASTYDPVTGGDLGWFPRGYLTDEQLDEAAFSLQPGEFTAVIQTAVGYHILQVIELDPDRLLDPETRLMLQENSLIVWIEMHRAQAQIETLIP